MRSLIIMLRKQDGRLSIARLASVITFILWCGTWAYTLLLGKTYAHFETVSICMLILMMVVLCSKTVDSKIISVKDDKTQGGK